MKKYLLCILCSCLVLSCTIKELQLTSVSGFTVNKINTEGVDANLMLKINNPNRFGFTILKSNVDVIYSGINLGKAQLKEKIKIKANDECVYTFGLKSDFKNVNLMDVLKLMNGSQNNGIVEVKGDLVCKKFVLRKTFPVSIKERLP